MSTQTGLSTNSSISLNETDYEPHEELTGLTAEQLKAKLLQTVKSKGILDSIKSHLRNKLVLELNSNINQTKSGDNNSKLRSNLALNTVNSLIVNHLKNNEYDYTLSVFMPECGMHTNEVFSLMDIFHILKISPDSKISKELSDSIKTKQKSLLWHLVNYFCSHYVTHDLSTQTDDNGPSQRSFTLDQKLKILEKQYADKSSVFDIDKNATIQEKLLANQANIEQKCKKEFEQKLKEFRENELEKIRVEERDRLRSDLLNSKQELERMYKARYESLSEKERNFDEIFKQKHDIEQRETFMQRQHILNELNLLRDKEVEFKRHCDLHAKEIESDLLKMKNFEDQLKKREFELKLFENNFEQKLCNEREKIKFDLERTFLQREVMAQNIEKHNNSELKRIETERQQLDRLKTDYQMQNTRLNELNVEVQKYKNELAILAAENKMFKDKLVEYLNYDVLKEENTYLKAQMESIKIHLGEKFMQKYHQANKMINLSDGRGAFKPVQQSKRSVTFAANADADQTAIKPEDLYEVGDNLLNTVDQQCLLENKFEEQLIANNQLRDLCEMQLYESRQLQNDVADLKVHMKFHQLNGLKMHDDVDGCFYGDNEHIERLKPMPADVVESTTFIECAKERLRSLESEAERVDRTFREYQHKMTSLTYPIQNDDFFARSALLKLKINDQLTDKQTANKIDLNEFVQKTVANTSLKTTLLQQDIDLLLNKNKILMSQNQHVSNYAMTEYDGYKASNNHGPGSLNDYPEKKESEKNMQNTHVSYMSNQRPIEPSPAQLNSTAPDQNTTGKTQEQEPNLEFNKQFNPSRNRIMSITDDMSQTSDLISTKIVPIKQLEPTQTIKPTNRYDDTDTSSSSSSAKTYSERDFKKPTNGRPLTNFENKKVKIEYEPDSEQSEENLKIEHAKQVLINSEDEDF